MNKMIEKFKNERIAVHCNTQEEYDELMRLLEKYSFRWTTGCKPTTINLFKVYGSETCITNDKGLLPGLAYCNKNYYETKNYKIIECKDFLKQANFEEKDNTLEVVITINKDGLSINKHLCESDTEKDQIEDELEKIEIKQEKTSNGNLINYAVINGQKCRLSLVQYEIIKKINNILEHLNEKDDD